MVQQALLIALYLCFLSNAAFFWFVIGEQRGGEELK